MYYPWLDVPILTAPMVIAIVALLHVFVSHYAVGGGLLLAWENSRALRSENKPLRDYWKKHAKFFILLTVPYGAITGVGIWFTIGLASPLATETLIRTFVFGWAVEWCFFLLELVSAFALYYFWDRFGRRASSFAGWMYALSAWISLVLITGITSFMLNSSGLLNDWESTGSFWDAFLNVQFIPQTLARTGCALTLGTFYVLLHASLFEKNLDVRETVTRHMRLPGFLGVFLLVVGVAGWLYFLPATGRATLERAAATNIFAGLFVGIIAGITLLLIVGPCLRPRETSPAMALALFMMGIAGISVSEFVREAVRKPYVVDRVVYGNQLYRTDVARARQDGMLYTGTWTSWALDELQEEEKYQDLRISAERYLGRESTHLLPPVKPEPATDPSEEEQVLPPSEPGDAQPQQDAADLLGQGESSRYVMQTVAYQQYQLNNSTQGRYLPPETPLSTADSLSAAANSATPPATTGALMPTANQFAPVSTPATPVNTPVENPTPAITPESFPATQGALTNTSYAQQTNDELVPNTPVEETLVPGMTNNALVEDLEESDVQNDVRKTAAELDLEINGPIARGNEDLLRLDSSDRVKLGRMVFLHHCNGCHAADHGYSAVAPLLSGRTESSIARFALTLNHSHHYMPPWSGTEVEAELLAQYLVTISPNIPNNAFQKDKPKKVKRTKEPKDDQEPVDEDATVEQGEPADANLPPDVVEPDPLSPVGAM